MLNKAIKLGKISLFGKVTLLLVVILAIFFLFRPITSYAQYYSYPYTNNQQGVTTYNASEVSGDRATLNGFVNRNGSYTTAWFAYGTSISLGQTTAQNYYGSGSSYYNAVISGLSPNTTYYYRAVAQGSQGIIYGNVLSFNTNSNLVGANYSTSYSSTLTATTISATNVSNSSVQLNSIINNQNGSPSNTWFEWGTNINFYSTTTPTETGMFPSVKHVNTLTGLSPGTTYYFRAVAQNSFSSNSSSILSFVTSGNAIQNTNTTTAKEPTQTTTVVKENATSTTPNTNLKESVESSLGANVIGSPLGTDSFLPVNIFGWLILTILVLILIFLSKYLFVQFSPRKSDQAHI